MRRATFAISKESVLKDVAESVELVLARGTCTIGENEPIINCIDKALKFGLHHPGQGYWNFILTSSHSSTLEALNSSLDLGISPIQKGIAWLCFTLVEGSLISCLGGLLLDNRALSRYYNEDALLRHKQLSSLFLYYIHQLSSSVILLLPSGDRMANEGQTEEGWHKVFKSSDCFKKLPAAISNGWPTSSLDHYTIIADKISGDRPCLDLMQCNISEDERLVSCDHQPNNGFMTSSVQSLTSPIDSGISLVESDVDNTCVSDATLENCKSEDDLLFTSMEDSGIIWNDSNVLEADIACSYTTQIPNDTVPTNDFQIMKNDTEHHLDNVYREQGDSSAHANMNNKLLVDNQSTGKKVESKISEEANKLEKSIDSNCDEIVFRRTKGRRLKKDKSKHVSFHEGDENCATLESKSPKTDNDNECNGNVPNERQCYSWCIDNLAAYTTGNPSKTNGEASIENHVIVRNESSATLSDSEVGVEVDCDSSSTLEEDEYLPIGNRKLYDKWTSTLRQLGLKKSYRKTTMPEPEIFHESTSSLNSSITPRRNEKNAINKVFKSIWSEKQQQHPIGKMLKSIKGQLMPVSEGQLYKQNDQNCFSPTVSNLNDKRQLARSGSTLEWSSDSDWSSEVEESTNELGFKKRSLSANRRRLSRSLFSSKLLQEASSKTSLVKRFLQSIPETKPIKVNLALNRRKFPLYIKGVKCDPELNKEVLEELSLEIENYKPDKRTSSVDIDENLTKAIRTYTLQSPEEKIYKVYQVSSLDGLPLLCVMSNRALYLTGISPINRGFCNHNVMQYSQLSSIIVGPNSQVMMLVAIDKSQRVTVLATLGPSMVSELLGHLELAVRRALGKSPISIQQLNLSDMTALKHIVTKQSPVQKDEELEHYVWVNIGTANIVPASTPLGPTKSGHLMFRPYKRSQWLPGYCLLKAGVLYVFADANQRLPNHAVPLHSGQCCGCRRVPTPTRPHTFEILLPTPGHTFQLAAPDEYQVSDWLQAFIQAASGDSDTGVIQDELAEAVTGCGLLLTTKHILTLTFPPHKVQSCIALQDLSSLKLSYNCCVLETGCKEMDEGGGDWIVYFATDAALEEFLDCLVRLQGSLAQSVVMMSDSDPLSSRCEQTSRLLEECWDLLLHPQLIS